MIKKRMSEFGTDNLSAFLRKMALEGTCENREMDKMRTRIFENCRVQLRRSAADFSEIVQGFGAFPQQDRTGV